MHAVYTLTAIFFLLSVSGPSHAATQDRLGSSTHLAQSKKSTKKKPRKKQVDDGGIGFGPEGIEAISDNDTGVGVHREQEGVDTPYFAEVTLLTDISLLSSTVENSEDKAVQLVNYAVDVQWLFLLGQIEIGPDFSYRSESVAVPVSGTDSAGKPIVNTSETTTSGFSIGGMFKFNFGNIDRDLTVFFAYAGAGYRAGETKVDEADPAKSSGVVVKAGGGVNIFMDSNVAFNPRAEFRMETDKDDLAEDAVTTTTSGLKILVGIGVFL